MYEQDLHGMGAENADTNSTYEPETENSIKIAIRIRFDSLHIRLDSIRLTF